MGGDTRRSASWYALAPILALALTGCAPSAAAPVPTGPDPAPSDAGEASGGSSTSPGAVPRSCLLLDHEVFSGRTGLSLGDSPAFETDPGGLSCALLYPDTQAGGDLAYSIVIANDESLYESTSQPGYLAFDSPGAGALDGNLYISGDRRTVYDGSGDAMRELPTRQVGESTCYVGDRGGLLACAVGSDFLITQSQMDDDPLNDAMMSSAITRFLRQRASG